MKNPGMAGVFSLPEGPRIAIMTDSQLNGFFTKTRTIDQ